MLVISLETGSTVGVSRYQFSPRKRLPESDYFKDTQKYHDANEFHIPTGSDGSGSLSRCNLQLKVTSNKRN